MLYEKHAETIPTIPLATPRVPAIIGKGDNTNAAAPSDSEYSALSHSGVKSPGYIRPLNHPARVSSPCDRVSMSA